ncbi:MAG: VanW family protein [Lachnospiraceae bacterium]|nr:VanW family protein [Lachnospiraceae bacterium]
MKRKNKLLSLFFVLGCILAVLVGFGAEMIAAGLFSDTDQICEGVQIGTIDVGGMTEEEASIAVEEQVDRTLESVVSVQVSGEELQTSVKDLGVSCDWQATVDQAYQLGKDGNPFHQLKVKKQIKISGKQYDLPYEIEEDTIQEFVEERCKPFDVSMKNSKLQFKNGKLKATKDRTGHEVQVSETVEKIRKSLEETVNQSETGAITIDAVVEDTEPEYTQEEVSKCEDLLGSYSTSFASSAAPRANNVKTAADYINGTVLYPGETFSTIKVIKDRTEENGYQAAPEYSSGNVVDGIGGGVCQVSTTLYNAVINAELEIVERSPHSMVVSYVDVSRDAAISGDYKDFKFKNNTQTPVYIAGSAQGGTLTFRVYGEETRPENRKIEFESETLETIQPGAPVETVDKSKPASYRSVTQSAHVGYRAKLWKIVYVDGEQTEKIELNSSSYKAEPEHITVGAAKATPTPKPSAKPTKKPKDAKATKAPKKTEKPVEPTNQAVPEPTQPPAEVPQTGSDTAG